MKKVVLRPNKNAYNGVCMFLEKQLQFELVEIGRKNEKSIQSHLAHLVYGFCDVIGVMKNLSKIKKTDVVISIGNISTLWLLFLNKMHIIKPKIILWWGFFIHGKKSQALLNKILKGLYLPNIKFIVFSKYELTMYQRTLGLPEQGLLALPYGDWGDNCSSADFYEPDNSSGEEYFFAGGYSNRDYGSLLDAWQKNFPEKKLIIIGSVQNKDLLLFAKKSEEKDKIRIMFDTSSEVFDDYLKKANACILPFKENTGASGQSVMLRCMRLNKLVIAVNIDVIQEYVDHGSAFLIGNYENDLVSAVYDIEHDKKKCMEMLQRQQMLYYSRFSYKNITSRLKEIIEEVSN